MINVFAFTMLSIPILGILAWTFFEAAKQSNQKQDLMDLAYQHGVDIDEARIARAVQAGHGDLLEKRILAGKAGSDVQGQ